MLVLIIYIFKECQETKTGFVTSEKMKISTKHYIEEKI